MFIFQGESVLLNLILLIFGLIFFDTAILNWVLPYVIPPSIQFGVRIPRERESDPSILMVRSQFHRRLLVWSILIFAFLYVFPAVTTRDALAILSVVFEVILSHISYYLAFRKLHRIKITQHWYDGVSENIGVIYEDQPGIRRTLASAYFILPAVAILALAIYIGVSAYPHLPSMIPTSFSGQGYPTAYSPKNIFTVFYMTIYQGIATAGIFFAGYILAHTRQELDISRPYTTYEQQNRFKSFYRDTLYVTGSMYGLSLFIESLRRWEFPSIVFSTLVIVLPILTGALLLVFAPLLTGQMGSRLAIFTGEAENTGDENVDDDKDWKAGMIDFNRQDPSLLVAKRFGIGWTLNFGNPRTWVILGMVSGLIIAVYLFLILRI